MLEYLTFGLIIQLFVNGILFGTMYGIAAIGLSLIFGTMRIIFLAQGTTIIFFAYVCFWLFTLLGIDPYLSLIFVVPISLLLGVVFYHALFREAVALEDKNISLLIAIGLMFLEENLITVIWTADPRSILTAYTSYVFRPMGIDIPFTRLMALLMAALTAIPIRVFFKKRITPPVERTAIDNPMSRVKEISISKGLNTKEVYVVRIDLGLAVQTTVMRFSTRNINPIAIKRETFLSSKAAASLKRT